MMEYISQHTDDIWHRSYSDAWDKFDLASTGSKSVGQFYKVSIYGQWSTILFVI